MYRFLTTLLFLCGCPGEKLDTATACTPDDFQVACTPDPLRLPDDPQAVKVTAEWCWPGMFGDSEVWCEPVETERIAGQICVQCGSLEGDTANGIWEFSYLHMQVECR